MNYILFSYAIDIMIVVILLLTKIVIIPNTIICSYLFLTDRIGRAGLLRDVQEPVRVDLLARMNAMIRIIIRIITILIMRIIITIIIIRIIIRLIIIIFVIIIIISIISITIILLLYE